MVLLLMELDERQDLRVCSDPETLRIGAAAEATNGCGVGTASTIALECGRFSMETNGCGVGTSSTIALARGRFSMERPMDAAASEELSPLAAKMDRR